MPEWKSLLQKPFLFSFFPIALCSLTYLISFLLGNSVSFVTNLIDSPFLLTSLLIYHFIFAQNLLTPSFSTKNFEISYSLVSAGLVFLPFIDFILTKNNLFFFFSFWPILYMCFEYLHHLPLYVREEKGFKILIFFFWSLQFICFSSAEKSSSLNFVFDSFL